ncbi:hypothetical protein GCM10010495_65800 [Kitasatospora herbaricolor]|uniref:hypothetical protein n=1 Tax=Kitasatospora herbaricolor TaxID=68217 RepID=UPI00174A23DC|nr:hypothetical protein [Kitasatospora herbaricolor]MDQ0313394.1 hypothetical protein [Kitasatospora herbaricolor]GGV39289.1 hypothetical protein GCM10010495_65800 [Kitasatospora herbaricolor]
MAIFMVEESLTGGSGSGSGCGGGGGAGSGTWGDDGLCAGRRQVDADRRARHEAEREQAEVAAADGKPAGSWWRRT